MVFKSPDYVRDNIPVDLLALGFADWVEKCPDTVGTSGYRPSGYVSTMAEFVERVAVAFRTGLISSVQSIWLTKQTFLSL